MTVQLSKRGPDASGYYFDEGKGIGLGHRRLSILDLSEAANQPMHSHCNRYVMVFNGEVYNFKTIAQELKTEFKTTSDSEVLLEAFVKWGVDFVNHLNGMFSIAIYDKQEEKLYLFRDRMGIKPLYYYFKDGVFLFSSELKSLTHSDYLNNGELDKNAINEFLYLGYIPAPRTIYQNISKITSGSFAIIQNGDLTIKNYWKLEDQIADSSAVISDLSTAKSKLKKHLYDAVEKRLVSDVPLGTFLSGGIDSSIVSAVAQDITNQPIKTFSIGFQEADFNEAIYAQQVAQHLKSDHYEKILSYRDVLDLFDDLLDVYDEPFADSSAFPTLLVSKFAKEHVSVILSGDGGDETYLGYGAYNWANRLNKPLVNIFKGALAIALKQGGNRFKRAAGLFEYKDASRIKSHIFSQEQYLFSAPEIQALVTPEYKGDILIDEHFENLSRKLNPEEEQALFDLKYYLQDDLLVKVDRASMWHSLEVRVPLLDHNMVKFALNLDPNLRKRDGVTKFLLKEVLYDLVPQKLFDRPKRGFSIPLVHWLQNEWRFLIDEYLSEKAIEDTGVFNYYIVNQLVHRFLNGETYLYNRLWVMLILQVFLLKKASLQ